MLAIERAIPLVVDALSKDSGLFSFDDLESGDALYPELLSDVHDIFLVSLKTQVLKITGWHYIWF